MTTTTNLGLTKPTVGGSDNTWGGTLNNNLDSVDAIFAGAGNGTSVGLNVGSGKTLTVAGTATISGTTTISGTLTVPDDSIALGTKTTGNYVGTIAVTSGHLTTTGATTGEGIGHTLGLPSVAVAGTYNSISSITVDAQGRLTGLNTSASDENLKTNIANISSSNSLDKIKNLQPVTFNWKDEIEGVRNTTDTQIGLIAQQVEDYVPEAIINGPEVFGGENVKKIDYNSLVALLIGAIKELEEKVKTLENA
jgi:hypothetical protein